ncbi:unnamed protein product [Allacma fusca]|uniref:Uncharacterized protein n=1 Tax=Allacma fusca TaxID=39272 RepID=A0A8J2NWS9_9HEXA|nr:unnamed protein product [Allacma fusca]
MSSFKDYGLRVPKNSVVLLVISLVGELVAPTGLTNDSPARVCVPSNPVGNYPSDSSQIFSLQSSLKIARIEHFFHRRA